MSSKRIPNEKRRAASIEAVLAAARSLFVAQGYEYTTMSQIARSAGLTKGAIYFYFKDKAELLNRLMDESDEVAFQPVITAVETCLNASERTATDRLAVFVNSVAQLGVDNREHLLLPVLMAVEFGASDSAAGEKVKALYARWTNMLERLITEGQATGEFARSLDPKNSAITFVGLVDGLLLQWHRLNDSIDGPKLAATARQIVLNAVKA